MIKHRQHINAHVRQSKKKCNKLVKKLNSVFKKMAKNTVIVWMVIRNFLN